MIRFWYVVCDSKGLFLSYFYDFEYKYIIEDTLL